MNLIEHTAKLAELQATVRQLEVNFKTMDTMMRDLKDTQKDGHKELAKDFQEIKERFSALAASETARDQRITTHRNLLWAILVSVAGFNSVSVEQVKEIFSAVSGGM